METVEQGDPQKIKKAKSEQENKTLRQARITAIVFALLTTMAFISLVYAYVQKGIAEESNQEAIKQTELARAATAQLRQCQEEAARQMKIAERNALEAQRQQKLAEEQMQRMGTHKQLQQKIKK
ncbi:MAG: hypothetical protein JST69_05505 [Bacteroidetes bacterium]|nr:hypothetical protein [Bacteroidota bacterium]